MRCGLDAADCIAEHWCPVLGAHREPASWRAPCPVCGPGPATQHEPLSFWRAGKSISWTNHCGCDRDDVRDKLAAMLPNCMAARRPVRVKAADVIALALADVPPQSRQLALLELAGLSTSEALAKIGVGPTHKGRVIAPVRRLRRLPVSVTIRGSRHLPVSVTAWVTRFGNNPHVRSPLTGG